MTRGAQGLALRRQEERPSRSSGMRIRALAANDGEPAARGADAADEAADRVRALWRDRGALGALSCCTAALDRFPLALELYHLRSTLLLELDRCHEAAGALRCALLLDRTSIVVRITLGVVLERIGDRGGARREYELAIALAAVAEQDAVVPLSQCGLPAHFDRVARARLARLD